MDPTPNKQYTQWILQRFRKGSILGLEDGERVTNALILFNNNKQKLPVEQRDINKIETLQDLEDLVEPFEGKVSNRQQEKVIKQNGAEVYYEDNDWLMLKITKPEALCTYGKNTKWCTSNINTAKKYIEAQGFLFVFIDKKNNRKYQCTPNFRQSMDERDRPVVGPDRRSLRDVIKKSGYEDKIKKDPELAYNYAVYILKKRFREAEPYIILNVNIRNSYLKNVVQKRGRWKEIEKYLKDPREVYWYAKNNIKGRWPEAEKYIVKDPRWAYSYAAVILNGRFPEAEPYIEKSPKWAYYYAKDVIKGRWKEAEDTIKTSPDDSYIYAIYVLRDRFPEAEEHMKEKDPELYDDYLSALERIKERNRIDR